MRRLPYHLIFALILSLAGHAFLLGALPSGWLTRQTPPAPLPPPLYATLIPLYTEQIDHSETVAVHQPSPPPSHALHQPAIKKTRAPKHHTETGPFLQPDTTPDHTADTPPASLIPSHPSAKDEPDSPPSTDPIPVSTKTVQAPAIQQWPEQGSITYRVYMGQNGFQVGEAEHTWRHDQTRYEMELALKTNGVIGLIHHLRYKQRSEGKISSSGLQPDSFEVKQQGKSNEQAVFDWEANRVSIRREDSERRSATLTPGDQDILSIWHQIGLLGTAALPHSLLLIGNKDAKAAELAIIGTEQIDLPIGSLNTLRLQAHTTDASLSIDIWLALDYAMLPVRTRLMDKKGDILDQQAVRLRLARPTTSATTNPAENELPQAHSPTMIELKENIAGHLDTLPHNN